MRKPSPQAAGCLGMLIGVPIFLGGAIYGFLQIARNPVGIFVGVLLPFAFLAALFVVLVLGWGIKVMVARRGQQPGRDSVDST